MSRADRLALLFSLLAVLAAYLVTERVFERMAHIEDEMAYVWQAQAIARGRLTIPSPSHPKSFLVPFVVDYQGQRFGKYPPGWPAILALGILLGERSLVNPLLAGLGVWLTYHLGKRCLGEASGLLAVLLTLSSPFFLMNSGSLLSHPFGLVLSAGFAMAWLDSWDGAFQETGDGQAVPAFRRWLPVVVGALCLGVLALTRPLTAVAVALPFGLHGLYLLVRGGAQVRRKLLVFCAIVLALVALYFVWQYAVTGDALHNPYTLWWEYDRVGFGPGFGRTQRGHNLNQAWINTRFSLRVGAYDLFGWAAYSWVFLPLGLLAALRNRRLLLLGSVFPSLVVLYLAYWIGANLFGPRYYYEGLYSLTLLSAAGIALLAGWPTRPGEPWRSFTGWRRARPLGVTGLLALLLSLNLAFYAPLRVGGMHGLYLVNRARLQPFLSPQAQEYTPALVIVHPDKWTEYGALLELQDPFLDTPFIFVISRGRAADEAVSAEFPNRSVYHYYPEEPYVFYTSPRPDS